MNKLKQLIKDSQELRKTTFLSPKQAVDSLLGENGSLRGKNKPQSEVEEKLEAEFNKDN